MSWCHVTYCEVLLKKTHIFFPVIPLCKVSRCEQITGVKVYRGPKSATRSHIIFYSCCIQNVTGGVQKRHDVFGVEDQLCLYVVENYPQRTRSWTYFNLILLPSDTHGQTWNSRHNNHCLRRCRYVCFWLCDCCLGLQKAFPNATFLESIEEEKWKCHWLTSRLAGLLEKRKIHLGAQKWKDKGMSWDMALLMLRLLCEPRNTALRKGVMIVIAVWILSDTLLNRILQIFIYIPYGKGAIVFHSFFLLLAWKIIAAFKNISAAYSKWAPEGFCLKNFHFMVS